MRLLFVKRALEWPRSSGHDVYTYHTMKACAGLGHPVALATVNPPSDAATAGLVLDASFSLRPAAARTQGRLPSTWAQKRFRSFYGVAEEEALALAGIVEQWKPDAVAVVGLDTLPYLPALSGVARVWYAGDEWVSHHLSQLRLGDASFWSNLREAVVKGLYERVHRGLIDRVWVVSQSDRTAMRWLAGMRAVDLIALGVDTDFFAPGAEPAEPNTGVFWGRLDFGPNIQALQWFCQSTWPLIRRDVPDARFTIIGYHPTEPVLALGQIAGVSIAADLADVRPTVRRHAMAILPFVSGRGVKNKFLEGAAMGMPMVGTPLMTNGLRTAAVPAMLASTPTELCDAVVRLWKDRERRIRLGEAARAWVVEHHSWERTAQEAVASLA
jgi:polysaccharide biosynthesis protein PslH